MEKKFKRSLESLSVIFDFIDGFLAEEKVQSAVRTSLYLAAEELFTNMVKHSPHVMTDVSISLRKEPGSILLQFKEQGAEPFDLTKMKDPDLYAPLDRRKPGGLGIFLTKKMVDRIDYEHRNGMNIITLTKFLRRRNVRHTHE